MKAQRQQGFTLIEMMVAIAIFALLSLMATQILRSMLQSHNQIQSKTQDMAQVQLAMGLIERDISQATVRLTAEGSRPNSADFLVFKDTVDSLELVRRHRANPGAILARSSIERVRYRLVDNQLERLSYPTPDSALSQARVVPVLQDVTDFTLRFWHSGDWQEKWSGSAMLPAAIEVTLELADMGRLRRVILLGGSAL